MHGRVHYRASIIEAGALGHGAVSARRGRVAVGGLCAEREERSYRHYIEEHAGAYRKFFQLSPREQRAYWSWRLTHEGEL